LQGKAEVGFRKQGVERNDVGAIGGSLKIAKNLQKKKKKKTTRRGGEEKEKEVS